MHSHVCVAAHWDVVRSLYLKVLVRLFGGHIKNVNENLDVLEYMLLLRVKIALEKGRLRSQTKK